MNSSALTYLRNASPLCKGLMVETIPVVLAIIGVIAAISGSSWSATGLGIATITLGVSSKIFALFAEYVEESDTETTLSEKKQRMMQITHVLEGLCYIILGSLALSGHLSAVQLGHGLYGTFLSSGVIREFIKHDWTKKKSTAEN